MRRTIRRIAAASSLVLGAVAMTGCSDGPTIPKPEGDVRVAFREFTSAGGSASLYDGTDAFSAWIGTEDPNPREPRGTPVVPILEDIRFSPGDAPAVVQLTEDDGDPDFQIVAAKLTDVEDGGMAVGTSILGAGGGSSHGRESSILTPVGDLTPGPGFFGLRITRFVLVVDELTVTSPGSNPNGNGIWTDHTFRGRIDIYASAASVRAVTSRSEAR